MKTEIVTLKRDNQTIKLVGCCHIGSESYYKNLQSEINEDSTVLYEGVKGLKNKNLSKFYKMFGEILQLSSQKDSLLYSDSWVLPDVDYDFIISANGGNVKELDKIIGSDFDVLNEIKQEDEETKKLLAAILLFVLKIGMIFNRTFGFLMKKSRFKKIILDLRNYKVILDTIEHLKVNNNIIIVYGQAHLYDIIKTFESLGFDKEVTAKYNVFK